MTLPSELTLFVATQIQTFVLCIGIYLACERELNAYVKTVGLYVRQNTDYFQNLLYSISVLFISNNYFAVVTYGSKHFLTE